VWLRPQVPLASVQWPVASGHWPSASPSRGPRRRLLLQKSQKKSKIIAKTPTSKATKSNATREMPGDAFGVIILAF